MAVVLPTHERADALRRQRGHGRFHALVRLPETERARPFAVETCLWFFSGFFKERSAWAGRR